MDEELGGGGVLDNGGIEDGVHLIIVPLYTENYAGTDIR